MTMRLDDKTLQFRLPEPYAPFLDLLTFGVLLQHLLGELSAAEIIDAQFNLNPVGSGPYQFDSLMAENGTIQGVILRAFEGYYLQRAFIEEFIFRYYPSAGAALDAYGNQEVLGISQIPIENLDQAISVPGLGTYTSRLPELSLVLLNLDSEDVPFFQDRSPPCAVYGFKPPIYDQPGGGWGTNVMQGLADVSGHLTPNTLASELAKVERNGCPVYLYHLKPAYEAELRRDLARLRLPGVRVLAQGEEFVF